MIQVYTEQSKLTSENRPHVFPLLFDMYYNENPDPRIAIHYRFTDDASEADIFIYPIDINEPFKRDESQEVLRTLSLWKEHQKPIWVYTSGDYGVTLNDKEITQFRLGGFASRFPSHTEVIPAFIQDPYALQNKDLFYIEKQESPAVGFVGFSSGNIKVWGKAWASTFYGNLRRLVGKEATDKQSFYPAAYRRKQYLSKLEKTPAIRSDFIHRGQYRAGATNSEEREATTTAFFNNIFNNPYTLCVRGAGNFSVRFYEVLASGRIPLLIVTDLKLPLEDEIDWASHCIMVGMSEDIVEALQKWHSSKSTEDFEKIQRQNRILWESYLTRESYFCMIHNRLKP